MKKKFMPTYFSCIRKHLILFKGFKRFSNIPVKQTDGKQVSQTVKEDTSPLSQWKELQNLGKFDYELNIIKSKIEEFSKNYKPDKAIHHQWEFTNEYIKINNALRGVSDLESLMNIIKCYKGYLDSSIIFYRFYSLASVKYYNREVFTVLMPLLKNYLVKFDRQSINELFYAAAGAAKIDISDTEFWSIIEGKLVSEKLYKYLSLEQAANLALELKTHEKGSAILLKLLELEFVKHRKAISMRKDILKLVKAAYVETGSASEVLIAALNDPNIEVTKIEKLV